MIEIPTTYKLRTYGKNEAEPFKSGNRDIYHYI